MWTWLRVRLVAADALIRSEVGPPGLTLDQAKQTIQTELDALPGAPTIAAQWAAGARDSTVYARTSEGMATWALIEHDGDPIAAAHAWLEDYADTIRSAGTPVTVAKPR